VNLPISIRRAATALALLASGAGSTALAGNDARLPNPVTTISAGSGRIVSARLHTSGGKVFVSGLIRRSHPLANPPRGSHIDVFVLDSRQRVIEAVTASYLPRTIPHGRRGTSAHARYTARLAGQPPADASIRVVFHAGPASTNAAKKCAADFPAPPHLPDSPS
jgi:hypothetical protein